MDTTSAHTVTEYEQHRLDMLLWQADVHDRNSKKEEAFEIRAWVADFVNRQSEECCNLLASKVPAAAHLLGQPDSRAAAQAYQIAAALGRPLQRRHRNHRRRH
jgi:hypothetical protein